MNTWFGFTLTCPNCRPNDPCLAHTLADRTRCECHDCTQARTNQHAPAYSIAYWAGYKAGEKYVVKLSAKEVLAERERCVKIVEHATVYGESTDWAIAQIKRGAQ